MLDLFTKKNILITSAVLIGIIAIFPISGYVREEWDKRNYEQAIDGNIVEKNKELAPTKEKLSRNLLQSLKDKNKGNLIAMYCDPVAHRLHEVSRRGFNNLWQELKEEDYSEATIRFEQSLTSSRGEDIIISNVKIEKDTKDRDFAVDNKETYYCVVPINRQKSLDE